MFKFLQFFRINNAKEFQIISVEIKNLAGKNAAIMKVLEEQITLIQRKKSVILGWRFPK
ncbi:hypothetical protein NAL32_04185 [Chryseobacterium sp. Ch-15]|uniref:Uncharacterized protein n=1 Tax=Chryseobacterium muglaense TaxID=2893752 RepID=A0A9Q3UP61_9FLAO|nr:hypothetical protein [Chryseobacterium muglaense]MBD3903937.1 hypothetical protein [Chryseobacterium muglaense]MBD3903938.1 hypothetical protein [Chryseobacterium muglaense]MCC9032877.1 hypothetical protein [Chryseobacterium muglaense]MCC9032878.1 hypothetical protein [Chryseobacterium muglaense]MCM2553585.1 hypothetical protein [Chryseobacterium muglaense]